jgi:tetratricopeptide (TPR) repeat protein
MILFVLFSVSNIYAQKIKHLKKGNSFYKEKDYSNAVAEYETLWLSSAGVKLLGVDAKMNLADCYRIMDYPFKAQKLYKQIMRYADDRMTVYLEYGKVLMSLGKYDEAINQFEIYAEKNIKSLEPAKLIQQCRDIENIEPLFSGVDVAFQPAVNDSSTRQIGITYYGDAVVFTSDELSEEMGDLRAKNFLNLRACGLDSEGNLKQSDKFSHSLNGHERHDGPATFSRDGVKIFYSQSVKTREGGTALQIWKSFFREGKWSDATPLPFLLLGANFTHPTLSANGKTLYFASDMKGSLGGLDIWVTHYEEGRWTNPQNLGSDINTEKDDAWPFIHPDGDLYFSSKGHPGFGGFDVFRTRPLGNGVDWLPIENLGMPFNSSFSDISFIMSDDQTQGFLSSNRSKSYDIFRYVIKNAEKQTLPDDIEPRKSTGLSEIGHETVLDTDFPEQPEEMTDVEYVEFLKKLNEEGKLELPNANADHVDVNSSAYHSNTESETNSENSSTSSETNSSSSETNNSSADNKSSGVILTVILKVMDVANSRPLSESKVVVKNKFTQKEEVISANDKGEIEVFLQADQKYNLIGQCEGYKESSLPVSTMGVTSSDKAQANLPLEKE